MNNGIYTTGNISWSPDWKTNKVGLPRNLDGSITLQPNCNKKEPPNKFEVNFFESTSLVKCSFNENDLKNFTEFEFIHSGTNDPTSAISLLKRLENLISKYKQLISKNEVRDSRPILLELFSIFVNDFSFFNKTKK